MKLVVDLTRCQGYAQCAFQAPSVFRMKTGDALLYDSNPDDALHEQIVRAAAACPVQAIYIGRMGVPWRPCGASRPPIERAGPLVSPMRRRRFCATTASSSSAPRWPA